MNPEFQSLERDLAAIDLQAAAQVAAILDSTTLPGAQAGMLWSMLALRAELAGIRTALEDIAVALAFPSDDTIIEE